MPDSATDSTTDSTTDSATERQRAGAERGDGRSRPGDFRPATPQLPREQRPGRTFRFRREGGRDGPYLFLRATAAYPSHRQGQVGKGLGKAVPTSPDMSTGIDTVVDDTTPGLVPHPAGVRNVTN
ncbi:hypothetical protein GCM10009547_46440 [Sporichthya brevicatena]|uniref:Uncharacterized protein n=1 Tax=Sporichthya brevicatena TaxID=171442 RepID=A0ABN1HBK1_9ACTN